MNIKTKLESILMGDENDVKYMMMNIMLAVGLLIAFLAAVLNFAEGGGPFAKFSCIGVFIVAALSLFLSVKKKKPRIGAIIITFFVNVIVFPITFFQCGGIRSGMPLWLLLGLLVVWLFLDGVAFYVMLFLSVGAVSTCVILDYYHPELIKLELANSSWHIDVLSIILLVMLTIGIIFKYQTKLYEKQRERLLAQEQSIMTAMQEANSANMAKSQFLANMSHEIRTPINAIMGMNEMIMRESPSDDICIYSDNIKKATGSLVSLVNDILDLSTLEAGTLEIIPERYDLKALIGECYDAGSTRATIKELKYSFKNNVSIPRYLVGDKIRVKQIITNLITNAVKFTTTGGVFVEFNYTKLKEDTIGLTVTVKDTGSGIPKDYIAKILSPYTSQDPDRNRNIRGTGLGLSITKRLVDLMGGNFEISSELRVGSTFTVSIPQIISENVPLGEFTVVNNARNNKEYKPTFKAPEAKLLIVDDMAINLTVLQSLLKRTQIKIDAVLSGQLALEKCKETEYDLIFLDHMMPEMDGIETLHRIKKLDNANKDIPVIVITANAIVGAKDAYLEEGFDSYIAKPAKADELEKVVFKYLPEHLIQY